MKLSVRVRGEWFAIPCERGTQSIRWLGQEALRRYLKIKQEGVHVDKAEEVHEIRRTQGGALLDMDDPIKQVLDDNDYVSVGKNMYNVEKKHGHVRSQCYNYVRNTRFYTTIQCYAILAQFCFVVM